MILMLQNRKTERECGVGGRIGGKTGRATCHPVRLGVESGRRGAWISGVKIRTKRGFPPAPTFPLVAAALRSVAAQATWFTSDSNPGSSLFNPRTDSQVLPRCRRTVSSAGLLGGVTLGGR